MDITNIDASNAYAAKESAKPPIDSTLLKNQNQEVSESNLNQESTRQNAFEVNITQEAQDRLAAQPTPPPAPEASDQSPVAAQKAAQIVNIVA